MVQSVRVYLSANKPIETVTDNDAITASEYSSSRKNRLNGVFLAVPNYLVNGVRTGMLVVGERFTRKPLKTAKAVFCTICKFCKCVIKALNKTCAALRNGTIKTMRDNTSL